MTNEELGCFLFSFFIAASRHYAKCLNLTSLTRLPRWRHSRLGRGNVTVALNGRGNVPVARFSAGGVVTLPHAEVRSQRALSSHKVRKVHKDGRGNVPVARFSLTTLTPLTTPTPAGGSTVPPLNWWHQPPIILHSSFFSPAPPPSAALPPRRRGRCHCAFYTILLAP